MPAEGVAGYLKYRVLDPNSGAVVIPDLPHLHQSSWTVLALQPGSPSAGSIGSFKIPLHPPSSKDQYGKAKQFYDLLAPGQKVEGYLGDVITGTPRFSGVLTTNGFRKSFNTFEIGGVDTLWWLQQSQLLPGEVIVSGQTGNLLVPEFCGTQEVIWDDDFSGWNGSTHPNSSDYTVSSDTFFASDPYLGLPAIQSSAISPTIGRLTTNTTWSSSAGNPYPKSAITIHGTITAGTDTANNAGEASILILSDATAQNGIMAQCNMLQTGVGSNVWGVHAHVYTISAGTYTLQATATGVFTGLGGAFPFEVTAVLFVIGSNLNLKIFINGKDSGLLYTTASFPASGSIGLRFSAATGGSPAVYVNRLQFHHRRSPVLETGRFLSTTGAAGTRTTLNNITGSGQTHLDMIQMAMSMDGFYARKTPGAGFKADTIDYRATPGSDLSSSIRFVEGDNLEDLEVAPVAEGFSTDVKMNAQPGSDSGGSIVWGRIGAVGDMVLLDTVTDVGVPGYSLLVGYAQQIQGRKVNPWTAKIATVIRDAATADKWRELDSVLVDSPTLNVQKQKMLIVGYTFTEGARTQKVYLDQFNQGLAQIPQQRLARVVESISSTFQSR